MRLAEAKQQEKEVKLEASNSQNTGAGAVDGPKDGVKEATEVTWRGNLHPAHAIAHEAEAGDLCIVGIGAKTESLFGSEDGGDEEERREESLELHCGLRCGCMRIYVRIVECVDCRDVEVKAGAGSS